MEPIKTETYKGYTYEIYPDLCPSNPREWDNLGILCTTLVNESPLNPWEIRDHPYSSLKATHGEEIPVMFKVYKYEHGTIALNTTGFSCPWDSGQIGWIYAPRSRILEWFQAKRLSAKLYKQTEKNLLGEVETLSKYMNGEVYGFMIRDSEGELVDSCTEYYDLDDMEAEIKAIIDHVYAREMARPETRALVMELLE